MQLYEIEKQKLLNNKNKAYKITKMEKQNKKITKLKSKKGKLRNGKQDRQNCPPNL